LSIHIEKYYIGINPTMLNDWLVPLASKPSLLILSACYSGSFIDKLKAPNRTIMTSASATTQSFGCAYEDKNTYFIEALLKDKINPAESVNSWFARTSKTVLNKEIEKNVSSPSNSQLAF
jgi:Peptidase C13 family